MKYLSIIFILMFRLSAVAQTPDWSVNSNDYEYSMSFSGVVSIDTIENLNTKSKLAAWVGDELRGTADPFFVAETGRYYYLLLVYANTIGETVKFSFYDADTDNIINLSTEVAFNSDKNYGTFSSPYIFRNWENYLLNAFSFAGFDLEAKINPATNLVTISLPENTDPSSLVAVFQFDDATSVTVNGVEQVSGTTANDFTEPVEYVITTPAATYTWSVLVVVEGKTITGLNDEYLSSQFMVFPNPVTDVLNIKSNSKILEYEIRNSCGALSLRGDSSNGINVKDLPPGVYFIKVKTDREDQVIMKWLKN